MTMQNSLACVLVVSLACVLTVYLGYPMSLFLSSRRRRRRGTTNSFQHVTLVISAYNEHSVIRDKIENSLNLDYPADKLEIIVISDGSDDGTDDIVREYEDRGVVLYRQQPRAGKSAGLSRFVPKAKGDIVVFSDANSMYEPDAIQKLVRHFADPKVGFVVGHQRYRDSDAAATVSESLYWRYETWLKVRESRLGVAVCGDGAIYAIRKELFSPLRADDINDFTLPLRIVAQGYRGVFEEEAVCWEETADDVAGEFRRKARIVNRSLRAVLRTPQVLNPFRVGRFTFHLVLHKVLRWFVPFLLIIAFAANTALATTGSPFYQMLFVGQLAFYATALLGFVPGVRHWKPFYIASYFCLINAAAASGVCQCLLGRTVAVWNPERPAAPSDPVAHHRADERIGV